MKEIDHDQNEPKRTRWDAWEKEKANFEKDHGRTLAPSDLIAWLFPVFVVSVSLFLWRNGWPF